jgi:hypothetical protein
MTSRHIQNLASWIYTGETEKRTIIKTIIQTLYLRNYKNIVLKYTTKLITFWTRRLQSYHANANPPLTSTTSVPEKPVLTVARFCAATVYLATWCSDSLALLFRIREVPSWNLCPEDGSPGMFVSLSLCKWCIVPSGGLPCLLVGYTKFIIHLEMSL